MTNFHDKKMADNKELVQSVWDAVGGRQNVVDVTHCMTRLRFRLNDESIPNDTEVKKIPGVMEVIRNGGQYQVVIGPQVAKVYTEIEILEQSSGKTVKNENIDTEISFPSAKEKRTVMGTINKGIGTLTGCLTPLIPVLLCCGMAKMLASVLGPNLFNVLSTESNTYVLLTLGVMQDFTICPLF